MLIHNLRLKQNSIARSCLCQNPTPSYTALDLPLFNLGFDELSHFDAHIGALCATL